MEGIIPPTLLAGNAPLSASVSRQSQLLTMIVAASFVKSWLRRFY